jgi:N-carbamoyl-L-amino-acid hydrolase
MASCTFSTDLKAAIEQAAMIRGLKSMPMLSGAFHDALFVNRVAPAAMIFVPCRDGLSHNEAEHVEPVHAVAGCAVLAEATLAISGVALIGVPDLD